MSREPSNNSVNVFEQIDAVCREFRKALKQGDRPSIEQCLEVVGPKARANLLGNLLPLEIEYRRRAGENPSADEYLRRFTDYASVIRRAFFLSTMASPHSEWDTIAVPLEDLAATRIGDYRLVRKLGAGGFGVVYEAEHTNTANRVALKTLPTHPNGDSPFADGDRLHRFRQEFRSLSEMSHPNLVGMQSLEVEGEQWFFTMDLIDGVDLLSYVRPGDELDESRLRDVLPQLVSGILALHSRGVVHRDLKPSNVLVSANGHLVILDFGLVVELEDHRDATATAASKNFAGTPEYSAPEQLSGERVTASDWYAVGTILYEAITGELPFSGPRLEVLVHKQQEDAPSLVGRDGIPQDLAVLTGDLLTRDPKDRPDALAIATAVSATLQVPERTTASSDELLVGRDYQLSELSAALAELRKGHGPMTVFIKGRSGEGKTTLAEHFLAPLRLREDVVVLSGRCYDRESVPLKALDAIIDPLCSYLRACGAEAGNFLPEDAHMLAHLFPVLQRVEPLAKAVSRRKVRVDMRQVRHRAFLALKEMLKRISENTPIVLFIDDLQWGDGDSAEAVFNMLSPPDPPTVLLLGTYRSDESETSSFLQTWEQASQRAGRSERVVPVGPLNLAECMELVVARLGTDNDAVRRQAVQILQATEGNPYFLDQLIDCFDTDTSSFHSIPLHEIIRRKLGQLPEAAGELLEAVALSGHDVAVEEIGCVVEADSSVLGILTHMRNARLVRLIDVGAEQRVDTYHDKIREVVSREMIEAGAKATLHVRLGELIEEFEGLPAEPSPTEPILSPRVYDLANHFDAAEQSRKALTYALAAAEQARERFALETALDRYAVAERHAEEATRSVNYRMCVGLGETLLLAGRYKEAEGMLNEAAELSDDGFERARVQAMVAEIAYKTKSLAESVKAYEDVLRQLGVRVPKTSFGLVSSLVGSSIVHLLQRICPKSLYTRKGPPDKNVSLTLRVFQGLMYPTYFRSTLRHLWVAFGMKTRSERYPTLSVPPASHTEFGGGITYCLGLYGIGKRYIETGVHAAKQLDDLQSLATVTRHHGYATLAVGRFNESLKNLSEAATLLETRVADTWQLTITKFWITCVHFRLGNLANAIQQARGTFEMANRYSQHRLAQLALAIWSRASGGDLPLDELKDCFQPIPDDHTATIQMHCAETMWHLSNGRHAEAVDTATKAVSVFKRHWLMNQETVTALPLLARALREQAGSLREADSRLAKQLDSRSLSVARWGTRLTRLLRLEYPFALRELSLAWAARGRTRRALKFAHKSCHIADQQGATYEHAQSMLVCGTLAKQLGQPGAEEQIEAAQAKLAEFRRAIEAA